MRWLKNHRYETVIILLIVVMWGYIVWSALTPKEIQYIKDDKTGICFAQKGGSCNLATVPCDRVEKYLEE